MAAADTFQSLREFDLNELDFDNIGAWPPAIKILVLALAMLTVLAPGYFYHVQNLQQSLQSAVGREMELRQVFEQKAFRAANLDAHRQQMEEMEDSLAVLVKQLPGDTEVPSLLEDITNAGVRNGLEFASIDLQPEVAREYHIELPIKIAASGAYHDFGAFISGISGLSRIVTMHDFVIRQGDSRHALLNMEITARTYRYKEL